MHTHSACLMSAPTRECRSYLKPMNSYIRGQTAIFREFLKGARTKILSSRQLHSVESTKHPAQTPASPEQTLPIRQHSYTSASCCILSHRSTHERACESVRSSDHDPLGKYVYLGSIFPVQSDHLFIVFAIRCDNTYLKLEMWLLHLLFSHCDVTPRMITEDRNTLVDWLLCDQLHLKFSFANLCLFDRCVPTQRSAFTLPV